MSTAPPSFLTDSIVDPDESVVDSFVTNDGFCPDISLQAFMSKYQVSDDYSAQRRMQCLNEAVRQVNSEIKANRLAWMDAGYSTLDQVPEQPDNEDDTGALPYQPRIDAYLDAVYCFALKLMAERYRNTNTTQAATAKATEYAGQVDYWNGEYIRHTRFVNDDVGSTIEASTI